MRVGVVIAMDSELQPFIKDKQYNVIQHGSYTIYNTVIADKELYIVKQHMVGTICASMTTQMLISAFGVELILNFGVVGALVEDVKLCSVMVVDSVVHYELDTTGFCETDQVGKYDIFDDVALPTTKRLVDIALAINDQLPIVRCASGDKFVASVDSKKHLHQEFGATICDMESAGIVMTCLINNVEVFMIKAVSDTLVGGNEEFSANVGKAASRYVEFITTLLERI